MTARTPRSSAGTAAAWTAVVPILALSGVLACNFDGKFPAFAAGEEESGQDGVESPGWDAGGPEGKLDTGDDGSSSTATSDSASTPEIDSDSKSTTADPSDVGGEDANEEATQADQSSGDGGSEADAQGDEENGEEGSTSDADTSALDTGDDLTSESETGDVGSETTETSSGDAESSETEGSADTGDSAWIELLELDPSDRWGTEGTPYEDDACPEHQVLIGFSGYVGGSGLEAIEGRCAELGYHEGDDMLTVTPTVKTPLRGTISGDPFERLCPEGKVVHGFTLGLDDEYLQYLRVVCVHLSVREGDQLLATDHSFLPGVGDPSAFKLDGNCTEAGVGTGVFVHVRHHPSKFGTLCGEPVLHLSGKAQ